MKAVALVAQPAAIPNAELTTGNSGKVLYTMKKPRYGAFKFPEIKGLVFHDVFLFVLENFINVFDIAVS